MYYNQLSFERSTWYYGTFSHNQTKFDRTHSNVQHGCCTTSNYQYSTDINVGPNNEDAWGNFWSHTNVLVSKIPPPRSQLSHSIISVTWDSVFTFFFNSIDRQIPDQTPQVKSFVMCVFALCVWLRPQGQATVIRNSKFHSETVRLKEFLLQVT